jgi:hypothetical protein
LGTHKKAISIALLAVMLISTFAVLGINPVTAENPDQTPQVTYINGYPYVSQEQLKTASDVSQGQSAQEKLAAVARQPTAPHLSSNKSSLVYGDTTIQQASSRSQRKRSTGTSSKIG